MHVCLQKQCIRVQRERGAKPSEVRRLVFSPRRLPQFTHSFKIVLAEGGPDSPHEWTWSVNHWYLQAASDEELVPVDHANIGGQVTSNLPFSLRDRVVRHRCLCSEVHRKFGVKPAASPANKTWERLVPSFDNLVAAGTQKRYFGERLRRVVPLPF